MFRTFKIIKYLNNNKIFYSFSRKMLNRKKNKENNIYKYNWEKKITIIDKYFI